MKRVLICVRALALGALVSRFSCPGAAEVLEFHVAPDGSDAWSGARPRPDASGENGPFATLARARDVARERRGVATSVRILVHAGRYFLAAPLELTAADSGLVIAAAGERRPVLVGGRLVTGWTREGDGKLWWAPAPGTRDREWDFRLLVVNGEVRPRARLPKESAFEHASKWDVPWMSTSGGGWKRKPTAEELSAMKYRAGDLGPWLDITNAEITVYHMWDESCVGIRSHDPAAQTLTFATPCGHPPGAFGVKKFVLWNTREGMHSPGRWYLDRSRERLVYWPRPGEDMARAEVIAPTVESLIRVSGKEGAPARAIALRGLSLTVTTTPLVAGGFGAGRFLGAIALSHAEGCRIEGVEVYNVAGQGIAGWNMEHLTIAGCETRDVGACGVRIGGAENLVLSNRVHRSGILYPSAIALSTSGARNTIAANDVDHAPYSGITASGNDHLIEDNRISRVMRELHDGAGIYITFCSNITVRGNVVRDIADTGGYGASAYYLDEQARNCLVERNLSLGVNWPVHMHMATNNMARGNVFLVDGDAKISLARTAGAIFERNILCATGDVIIRGPANGIAAMPSNIFYTAKGKLLWERLDQYASKGRQPLELRDGSVNADPKFRDIARGDLDLGLGSPARRLGIEPLPAALAHEAVARAMAAPAGH
ncbi:MAG TPA: right-handed parallel beta-helix repeat-containing protein [Verrucomicrobiae bacterium]|nr:right-handed parallel beta-helix repeat-containing protein [Verrucomicrobiae bacterium]